MMEKDKVTRLAKDFASAGVVPFAERRIPSVLCSGGIGRAELSLMDANTPLGVLPPEVYTHPTDKTKLCISLFETHLMMLCRSLKEEKASEIWLYASPKLIASQRAARIVKRILAKCGVEDRAERICLLFPSEVLWLSETKSELQALSELRVKIAIDEVGEPSCPLTALEELPIYAVRLHEKRTADLLANGKSGKSAALVGYFKALLIKVFASDAENSVETKNALRVCGVDAFFCKPDGNEEVTK